QGDDIFKCGSLLGSFAEILVFQPSPFKNRGNDRRMVKRNTGRRAEHGTFFHQRGNQNRWYATAVSVKVKIVLSLNPRLFSFSPGRDGSRGWVMVKGADRFVKCNDQ